MNSFEQDIESCIETLAQGGVILYPTDTIWGLGCDATNASAVRRVYSLKHRDDNKALIVLLDSEENLSHYVVDIPEMAHDLMTVAVKPLTLIFEGAYNLCPDLLGENDSIGIRVPREEFCHQLCKRYGKPIVSTSANLSGSASPRTFSEIEPSLVNSVDYVVRYRQTDVTPHQASNIIMLRSDGTFKIIR